MSCKNDLTIDGIKTSSKYALRSGQLLREAVEMDENDIWSENIAAERVLEDEASLHDDDLEEEEATHDDGLVEEKAVFIMMILKKKKQSIKMQLILVKVTHLIKKKLSAVNF